MGRIQLTLRPTATTIQPSRTSAQQNSVNESSAEKPACGEKALVIDEHVLDLVRKPSRCSLLCGHTSNRSVELLHLGLAPTDDGSGEAVVWPVPARRPRPSRWPEVEATPTPLPPREPRRSRRRDRSDDIHAGREPRLVCDMARERLVPRRRELEASVFGCAERCVGRHGVGG